MDFRRRIENLKRGFWGGDEGARDALARLLHRYVRVVVRRAFRQSIDTVPHREHRPCDNYDPASQQQVGETAFVRAVDEISRKLADELLQTPVVSGEMAKATEPIQVAANTLIYRWKRR